MVEIFGKIAGSEMRNGKQVFTFRIPALSRSVAQQRAKLNAGIKNMSNPQVVRVEEIQQGQLPGQTIYSVEVEGGTTRPR